jgi:hypothetical protein
MASSNYTLPVRTTTQKVLLELEEYRAIQDVNRAHTVKYTPKLIHMGYTVWTGLVDPPDLKFTENLKSHIYTRGQRPSPTSQE